MNSGSVTLHPPMHPEEFAFRCAINDNPRDWLAWDVYADWLQDRDDVRAQAARLMRCVRLHTRDDGQPHSDLFTDGEPVGVIVFRFWSFFDLFACEPWWSAVREWRDYDTVGKRFRTPAEARLALLDAWPAVGESDRGPIVAGLPERHRAYGPESEALGYASA